MGREPGITNLDIKGILQEMNDAVDRMTITGNISGSLDPQASARALEISRASGLVTQAIQDPDFSEGSIQDFAFVIREFSTSFPARNPEFDNDSWLWWRILSLDGARDIPARRAPEGLDDPSDPDRTARDDLALFPSSAAMAEISSLFQQNGKTPDLALTALAKWIEGERARLRGSMTFKNIGELRNSKEGSFQQNARTLSQKQIADRNSDDPARILRQQEGLQASRLAHEALSAGGIQEHNRQFRRIEQAISSYGNSINYGSDPDDPEARADVEGALWRFVLTRGARHSAEDGVRSAYSLMEVNRIEKFLAAPLESGVRFHGARPIESADDYDLVPDGHLSKLWEFWERGRYKENNRHMGGVLSLQPIENVPTRRDSAYAEQEWHRSAAQDAVTSEPVPVVPPLETPDLQARIAAHRREHPIPPVVSFTEEHRYNAILAIPAFLPQSGKDGDGDMSRAQEVQAFIEDKTDLPEHVKTLVKKIEEVSRDVADFKFPDDLDPDGLNILKESFSTNVRRDLLGAIVQGSETEGFRIPSPQVCKLFSDILETPGLSLKPPESESNGFELRGAQAPLARLIALKDAPPQTVSMSPVSSTPIQNSGESSSETGFRSTLKKIWESVAGLFGKEDSVSPDVASGPARTPKAHTPS